MPQPEHTSPVQDRKISHWRGLALVGQIGATGVAVLGVVLAAWLAGPIHPFAQMGMILAAGLPLLAFIMQRSSDAPPLNVGISLLSFAGLLTFLAAASGGLASPFSFWLLIIPFAAIRSGGMGQLIWSGILLALSMAILASITLSGASGFTSSMLSLAPPWTPALVIGIASAYAVLLAARMGHQQQVKAKSLKVSGAHLQMMIDGSPDAIIHIGGDGRIAYASAAASEVLSAAASSLLGQSLSQLLSGEDRREMQRALARTSYFGSDAELTFKLPGNPSRWIEMRCRPTLGALAQNRAAAFETIAVLRDVSAGQALVDALRQDRTEAEEANAAKSRFLANMSHELRTPLNAIIGFSDMMMSEVFGPLGNPRYSEYVQHIKQGGEHLSDLINDVLDMSKIEAGRFDLELELLSVPHLIEEVLTTVSVTAARKKIELDLDMKPGLPSLNADRRAVKQMLLNLLANAIKFTPLGGQVVTSVRRDGGSIVFEVRDTGIGIAEEDLLRLGLPFEQAARQGSNGEAGTGLGLALVKALAELHGGQLNINSSKGEGTVVTVNLPMQGMSGRGIDGATPVLMDTGTAAREVA